MSSAGKTINGVSSVDITTDNLQVSTEFYTEILGGKLLNQFSEAFKGDDLSGRIFGKELQEAKDKGVDPATLGVPDISDTGKYQVSWNFILFDNIIVKLVQYTSEDGTVLSLRDERTSAAIVPNPHLAFWVQDVDLNKYIRAVENAAAKKGMKQVFFNRTVAAETEAERALVPEDQLANFVREGNFAPFDMIYFKGPTNEQLELFKLKEPLATNWGKALSTIGTPSTAYLPGYEDNGIKKRIGLTAKLFGMNHFGIRVVDMEKSVKFYSKVLGGDVMPFQADDLGGDMMQNAVYQKELFEAKSLGRSRAAMAIPDVSSSGSIRVALRFVQFGTATLELLTYYDGQSGYNPRYDWTSPAYCNTMTLVFNVQEGTDFNRFLLDIEAEAVKLGFPDFTVNRSPTADDIKAFRGRDIHGYNFAVARGPSGEHIGFCQFSGTSRKILHDEIASYGGVSPMFADLSSARQ